MYQEKRAREKGKLDVSDTKDIPGIESKGR